MGEARRRGTIEKRKEQAIAEGREKKIRLNKKMIMQEVMEELISDILLDINYFTIPYHISNSFFKYTSIKHRGM